MNFIFLSPNFPENYYLFTQGLKNNGVNTFGIGDAPYDELSEGLKNSLDEYYKVGSLENYDEVYQAVEYFQQKYGDIDFLESNNEYWLERDASLRTQFNIQGLNEETIKSIRYKSGMKSVYEKAGCKVARYHLVTTFEEGCVFIEQVGYPVVVKPDNGMGAATTFKIKNEKELTAFYKQSYPYQMIMEEFVEGELFSYDGIANSKKEVVYETQNIYPTPIMDIVNERKDVYFYSLKEVEEDVKEMGRKVVAAFDTNSRFFHCEYFRLTKSKVGLGVVGDIVGLEVNMRPPGGNAPDVMNFARDINVYQLWANMIAFDDAKYDLQHPSMHGVFASRRDSHTYKNSLEYISEVYNHALRMNQRGPEALAEAMGNHIFIACFETMEEVNVFANDIVEH